MKPNLSINEHPLLRLPVFAVGQREFLWRFYQHHRNPHRTSPLTSLVHLGYGRNFQPLTVILWVSREQADQNGERNGKKKSNPQRGMPQQPQNTGPEGRVTCEGLAHFEINQVSLDEFDILAIFVKARQKAHDNSVIGTPWARFL